MAKTKKIALHPKLAAFQSAASSRTNLDDILVKPNLRLKCINSGSTVLNMLAGGSRLPDGAFVCPGWPRGRMVEIFGRESSGKSTLALTAMAQGILNSGADDGCGLYIDNECAVIDHYAMQLGVDFRPPEMGGPGNAFRAQPHTFEETEALVNQAAINGVDVIVIDSVAGLVSEREVKRDVTNEDEKKGIAEVPRLMSGWLPQLQNIISRTGTLVIFLNQTRDIIGTMAKKEESKKSTTGGNALKFWTAIRMMLKPTTSTTATIFNPITKQKEKVQIATDIVCKMIKNKIDAKQGHSGLITIRYGVGVDELRTMMNVGGAYNVIKKKSSWYTFTAPGCGKDVKGNGLEQFRLKLQQDQEALGEFLAICTDHIVKGYRIIDEETLAKLAESAITKDIPDDDYPHGEPPEEIHVSTEEAAAIVPELDLSGVADD
jgi:recombination protein RecA